MRKLPLWLAALALIASVAAVTTAMLLPSRARAQGADSDDAGWPRQFLSGGDTLFVYQPQLESWQGDVLTGRSAVAVYSPGAGQADYGVVWFTSRTGVDKADRRVNLSDIRVTQVKFPSSDDGGAAYQRALQRGGLGIASMSLDRVESSLAINKARTATRQVAVKNDPPDLQFATSPSMLVLIDGDPVVRPVENTRLSRVINTRALLVTEDGRTWYLSVGDAWLRAPRIAGPYAFAERVPNSVAQIAPRESQDGNVDSGQALDDDVKALLADGKTPNVFVRTQPTELIVSDGPLEFTPIPDTDLLFADNTPADVFVDVPTQARYVLVSGRWFRAASLDGPWEFVAANELPEDFARIPEDHPKGSVLASIEGTPQSAEAAIANEIPQTAEVRRDQAKLETDYDGEPQFDPIEGTQLAYAENTDTPVIRFRPDRYYAVSNGVWFSADGPDGPWFVCTDVPASIYSIPPSCPIYYVTYVQVYSYTPDVVYVGYTPGYFGTCETQWNTVVYGTGWRWHPWIHRRWYGSPWSYGWNAAFSWSSYSGWSFGFGFGSTPYWRPWWGPAGWAWGWSGPYRPYYACSNYNLYHHWGRQAVAGRPRPAYGYVPPQGGRYPTWDHGQIQQNGRALAGNQRPAYFPTGLTNPLNRSPRQGGPQPISRPAGYNVGGQADNGRPAWRPGGGIQAVPPVRNNDPQSGSNANGQSGGVRPPQPGWGGDANNTGRPAARPGGGIQVMPNRGAGGQNGGSNGGQDANGTGSGSNGNTQGGPNNAGDPNNGGLNRGGFSRGWNGGGANHGGGQPGGAGSGNTGTPNGASPNGRQSGRSGDVYAGPDGNVYRPSPRGWQKYQGPGQWQGVQNQRPTSTAPGNTQAPGAGNVPQQLERDRFARQRGESRDQQWRQSQGNNAGAFDSGQPRVTMPPRGSSPVPQRAEQSRNNPPQPRVAKEKDKEKENRQPKEHRMPGDRR